MPRKRGRRARRNAAYDDAKVEREQSRHQTKAASSSSSSSASARRAIGAYGVARLVEAVQLNNVAAFGLVKLRKLDLDAPVVTVGVRGGSVGVGGSNDGVEQKNTTNVATRITLLEYAARQRCHPIVGRLLLAGADPRVRGATAGPAVGARAAESPINSNAGTSPSRPIPDVTATRIPITSPRRRGTSPRAFLQSHSLQYGAWIVDNVVRMRDAAIAEQSNFGADTRCGSCGRSVGDEPVLVPTSPEPASSSSSSLWCEDCLWDRIVEGDPLSDNEAVLCPPAAHAGDAELHAVSLRQRLVEAFAHAEEGQPRTQVLDTSRSLRLFNKLPEALAHSTKPKKAKLRAMSKRELRAFALGSTRAKRLQNWWRAAAAGDHLRLRELLAAGVDADARDENGDTALMMAQGAFLARIGDVRRALATNEEEASASTHRLRVVEHLVRTQELLVRDVRADTAVRSHAGCNSRDLLAHTLRALDTLALQQIPLPHLDVDHDQAVSSSAEPAADSSNDAGPTSTTVEENRESLSSPTFCQIDGGTITQLIAPSASHPGAGSFVVDGAFDDAFLQRLDAVWAGIPAPLAGDAAADVNAYTEVDQEMPSVGRGSKSVAFNANNTSRMSKDSARTFSKTCATRKFFRDREGWVVDTIQAVLEHVVRKANAESAGAEAGAGVPASVFPRMRFLHYGTVGGQMMPHVDLSKSDAVGAWGATVRSTHTFLLHLRDCAAGGETVLLDSLSEATKRAVRESREPGSETQVPVSAEQLAPAKVTVSTNNSVSDERALESQRPVSSAKAKAAPSTNNGEVYTATTPGEDGVLASVPPRRGRLLVFPHVCPHAGLRVGVVPKMFLRGEML